MKVVMMLIVGIMLGVIACDARDEEVTYVQLPITFNDEMRALDDCYWYGGNKRVTKYEDPHVPGYVTLKVVCVDGQVFIKHWH